VGHREDLTRQIYFGQSNFQIGNSNSKTSCQIGSLNLQFSHFVFAISIFDQRKKKWSAKVGVFRQAKFP
jgi:hypothetical protein